MYINILSFLADYKKAHEKFGHLSHYLSKTRFQFFYHVKLVCCCLIFQWQNSPLLLLTVSVCGTASAKEDDCFEKIPKNFLVLNSAVYLVLCMIVTHFQGK